MRTFIARLALASAMIIIIATAVALFTMEKASAQSLVNYLPQYNEEEDADDLVAIVTIDPTYAYWGIWPSTSTDPGVDRIAGGAIFSEENSSHLFEIATGFGTSYFPGVTYSLYICPSGEGTCASGSENADSFTEMEWYLEFRFDEEGLLTATSPEQGSHISNFTVLGYPTPDINFTVDYVSSTPSPTMVCVTLDNLTLIQTVDGWCQDITQSGTFTFSTSTTGLATSTYRAYASLYQDSQIIDNWLGVVFNVGSSTMSYDPSVTGWQYGGVPAGQATTTELNALSLECDPEDPFFVRSVCNLGVLLFVPSSDTIQSLDTNLALLMQKQPFSSFNEFRLGYNNAVKNPDVPYSTLTLNLYGEEVEVLSTSTLTTVAGDSVLPLMRGFLAIAMWIAFGWFAYGRVLRLF